MLTLPSMTQIIGWFGWGDGAGAARTGGVRADPVSYRTTFGLMVKGGNQ